jgi:hypothetical protein
MTSRYLASSWHRSASERETEREGQKGRRERREASAPTATARKAHWTEGDSSGSQAYETSVAGVWLVYSIGELVAELVENGLDSGIVLAGNQLAYDALESAMAQWCELSANRERLQRQTYSKAPTLRLS